ncbi:MAG: ATP phosphoribosyltransferase, partial [Alphaproteobacteria bacterium]|nr:ATP phosphoribosyltransferase [Alphaproteobacteria bacterium]
MSSGLVIAVPKGRIQEELAPLLKKVGITPEDAFFDDSERQLQFACRQPGISLIRVRSFDVATFVAFGAAHIGVAGSDVLLEFDYPDLYAPLNLDIGHCRLALAAPVGL